MRTILLTGKNGQLGWELQRTLLPLGRVVAVDIEQLNLASPEAIRQTVREVAPDIIINPAAYTNVDGAEGEPELAHAINAIAPKVLAEEAKRLNAWLVHYSTDYVFDGEKQGPYVESDIPCPLNVYGQTKLAGEDAVRAEGGRYLILRTSWIYGARGRNFMLTMLRLAKERDKLKIVNDQVGAPTWCRALAEMTAQIIGKIYTLGEEHDEKVAGTYHLTASGAVSWCDFAKAIIREAKVMPCPEIIPIRSDEYTVAANRPKNSMLSNARINQIFGLEMGDWLNDLVLCLQEMGVEDGRGRIV